MKYKHFFRAVISLFIVLPLMIVFIPYAILIALLFDGTNSINSFKEILLRPLDECESFITTGQFL
jgi:hypothetical protein